MASNPWTILAQARSQSEQLPQLYMQAKQRRMEDLYRQKQMDIIDRKQAAEDRRLGVMSRLFTGGDTASAASGSPAAPSSPAATSSPETVRPDAASAPSGSPLSPETIGDVPAAPASAMPAGLTPDQPLPPRTDGLVINQQALRELYAIDPTSAAQIQKTVYEGNEQQLKAATLRGEAMAQAATALSQVPPEQRAAEFQKWAPFLVQRGFHPDTLSQVDLSDAGLNRYYSQGRSLDKLIEGREKERDFDFKREQFGETTRHNRASEGVAAGNLSLSRQREGRITKWGPQQIVVGAGVPRTDTSDLDY